MGKRKYSFPQKAALDTLETVWKDWRDSKQDLKKQIQIELEERMESKRRLVSKKANEALALGVTKSDIKVAIHNGNWDSLVALLAMTAEDFDLETQIHLRVNYRCELVPMTGYNAAVITDDSTGERWQIDVERNKERVNVQSYSVAENRWLDKLVRYPLDGEQIPAVEWLQTQPEWEELG